MVYSKSMMAALVVALVPSWALGAPLSDDVRSRYGTDVTIRCSFDQGAELKLDRDLEIPACRHGRRDWLQAGRPDIYPRVESLTAAPLLLQRTLSPVTGGKYGQAARLGVGDRKLPSMLVFDAVGNLFPQRGTIAVWVRWVKQCPPFRTTGPIFCVTCLRLPGSRSIYLSAQFIRGHTLRVGVSDRFGEWHGVEVATSSLGLKEGQWHHFAVAWDNQRGVALYVDGKVRGSNWGHDRWHTRANLDALSVGHRHRGTLERPFGTPYSWTPETVLDADELVAFSRALSADEVRGLVAEGRLGSAPLPKPSADETRRHRMEMMGWGEGDALPEIPCLDGGTPHPTLVRNVEIRDAKAVKIGTHTPIDGQWYSRWPLLYHGYSVGNETLTLLLSRRESYNYIRLVGRHFAGRVGAFHRPKRRTFPLAQIPTAATAFRRLRLKPGNSLPEIHIHREMGAVNDVALFRIVHPSERSREEGPLRPTRFVVARQTQDVMQPPRGRRLGKYSAATLLADPEDRGIILWEPEGEGPAAPTQFTVPAGRFVQLDMPASSRTVTYSRVALDWHVYGLTEPTRIWLGLWEPVLRERFIWEFDWQATPRGDGPQRVRLEFDIPGVVVQPGQNVRFAMVADRALRLGSRSAIALYLTESEDAKTAYYENQLGLVKDVFGQSSEPRRWTLAGQPCNCLRQIARLLAQLESLGRLDRDDWRAGSLWRYMHLEGNRMGPWEDYTPPDVFPMSVSLLEPPGDCPEWAFWWKGAYADLRYVVEWWMDNRQIENGELGGGHNDDTDMVHEWANFHMLHDPDGKLGDSFCRLADFCWDQCIDGLPHRPLDSDLHDYEEGLNIIAASLLFRYGDPFYYNRAMISAQHIDGNLTALNSKGQRLHRWTSYDGRGRTRGRPVDAGWFFRMEPAMWLAWYNRQPTATRLLREWMDTRLSYYPTQDVAMLPGVIRFEDGKDLGSMKSYMGMIDLDTLHLLARITGERKYLAPVIDNLKLAAAGRGARAFNFGPRTWKLFSRFDAIGKAKWWPQLEARMNPDGRSPYESPYEPKVRAAMIEGLKAAMTRIRNLRGMFTWVEQSPDRVFFPAYPRSPFYRMALGGPARIRNQAPLSYHSVSYDNADGAVARWALEDGFDRLIIAFYSFHKTPRRIAVRPWLLDHGHYVVREGADENGDFKIDAAPGATRRMVLRRCETRVAIDLPPSRTHLLDIRLEERLPEVYDRADVALSSKDITYLPSLPALRIPVHNIGRGTAENVRVAVTDGDTGKLLWETTIDRVDWPEDLAPKTVQLFTGRLELNGAKRLRVAVDPDAKLGDFTRLNNEVIVSCK